MAMGRVAALWRYPVKSMQGEPIVFADVTERGIAGDRALALQDVETGKVASAKSPRMWSNLLAFGAAFVEPPEPGGDLPPIRISLPNGDDVRTDEPGVEEALSEATGRRVRLISENPEGATYDYYVAEGAGADGRSGYYKESRNDLFGTGSLHDASPIHVLTTASLDRLRALHPEGRIEARRFRPNVVVETEDESTGFVENEWVKRSVRIGEAVFRFTFPTSRCVMTTLAQDDLTKDPEILRTLARENRLSVPGRGAEPCLGVLGVVRATGTIRVADEVTLASGT